MACGTNVRLVDFETEGRCRAEAFYLASISDGFLPYLKISTLITKIFFFLFLKDTVTCSLMP